MIATLFGCVLEVPVEAVVRGVELAVVEPLEERRVRLVEDLGEGLVPQQLLARVVGPEPFEIALGLGAHRAVSLHAGDVRLANHFSGRRKDAALGQDGFDGGRHKRWLSSASFDRADRRVYRKASRTGAGGRSRFARAQTRCTGRRAGVVATVPDGRLLGSSRPGLAGGLAMTVIRQQDVIQSVADALQYISYYHPVDYIQALGEAYRVEESPAAKDAIAQILTNSRMCAEGHRPICQDTGIVVAFLKVGMDVQWEGVTMSVTDMVNEGVRRAYLDPDNRLRASIVADPSGTRTQHQGQHAGGRALRDRAGRHGRSEDRGQGRRLGEQVQVRDAESLRLDRRLGAEDRAHDGRGLVPAGHAGDRHRRQRGEGDAARQGIADGAHRHARAQAARAGEPHRGAAPRALREGQRARHRRAGSGRAVDGARREDPRLPDARGVLPGGDDPQLRGDAARAFHARRFAGRRSSSRPTSRVAGRALDAVAGPRGA